MNIHVPIEIVIKWPSHEFEGKPIKLMNGKTYMRAKYKCLDVTQLYCFEDDFFYFSKDDVDKFKMV